MIFFYFHFCHLFIIVTVCTNCRYCIHEGLLYGMLLWPPGVNGALAMQQQQQLQQQPSPASNAYQAQVPQQHFATVVKGEEEDL